MAQFKQPSCCPDCFKNKGVRLTLQHKIHDAVYKCYSCGFEVSDTDINTYWLPNIGNIKIPFDVHDNDNTPWRSSIDYIDIGQKTKTTPTFEEAISKFVDGMKYLEDRNRYKYPQFDGSDSFLCPRCSKTLTPTYTISYAGLYRSATQYRCRACANAGQFKYIYTSQELNVKTIQMCKTYQDTIVEIKIIGIPRKGWWDENAKPLIEFLKSQIPATDREYNAAIHIWSFDVKYWNNIETLFKALGWTIQVVSSLSGKGNDIPNINVPKEYAENFHYKQEVVTTQESITSIASQLSEYLGVQITDQDLKELKKLYRQVAMQLHPDRNSDPKAAAKMSELNRLWTLYTAGGVQ